MTDRTGRMNGRGAYLCDSLDCFRRARKKKAFMRAFQMELPEEIIPELEKELS